MHSTPQLSQSRAHWRATYLPPSSDVIIADESSWWCRCRSLPKSTAVDPGVSRRHPRIAPSRYTAVIFVRHTGLRSPRRGEARREGISVRREKALGLAGDACSCCQAPETHATTPRPGYRLAGSRAIHRLSWENNRRLFLAGAGCRSRSLYKSEADALLGYTWRALSDTRT